MKAWLYGLDVEEYASVSSILTFIGIEFSSAFSVSELPDFVVLGSGVGSIDLDKHTPMISLNRCLDVSDSHNVWVVPLPWLSQSFSTVLKEIKKSHSFPKVSGVNLNLHVRHLEALLIRQALLSTQGVVSKAAQTLQIQRTTLIEKMRRYNIDKSEF